MVLSRIGTWLYMVEPAQGPLDPVFPPDEHNDIAVMNSPTRRQMYNRKHNLRIFLSPGCTQQLPQIFHVLYVFSVFSCHPVLITIRY